MSDEKKGQDARAKFYNTDSVIRYLKTVGIPKRTGEFKDMVASGTKVKLESKREVKHPEEGATSLQIVEEEEGQVF